MEAQETELPEARKLRASFYPNVAKTQHQINQKYLTYNSDTAILDAMLKIDTSVDWQTVRVELKAQIRDLDYNPQYEMLLKNIDNMVTDLSKREVEARRLKKPQLVSDHLLKINKAIEYFEQIVIFNQLSF